MCAPTAKRFDNRSARAFSTCIGFATVVQQDILYDSSRRSRQRGKSRLRPPDGRGRRPSEPCHCAVQDEWYGYRRINRVYFFCIFIFYFSTPTHTHAHTWAYGPRLRIHYCRPRRLRLLGLRAPPRDSPRDGLRPKRQTTVSSRFLPAFSHLAPLPCICCTTDGTYAKLSGFILLYATFSFNFPCSHDVLFRARPGNTRRVINVTGETGRTARGTTGKAFEE